MKNLLLLALLSGCLASSANAQLTVNVTPQHVIRITTTNTVTVDFTNGPNPTVKDFVTVVPEGVIPVTGKIQNWQYLGGGTTVPPIPVAKGVLAFTVPAAGRYQAYLFRNGSAVMDKVWGPNIVDAGYASIDLDGAFKATVTRSKNLTDQVDVVITGDVATLVAPPGASVTVNGQAQPGLAGGMP